LDPFARAAEEKERRFDHHRSRWGIAHTRIAELAGKFGLKFEVMNTLYNYWRFHSSRDTQFVLDEGAGLFNTFLHLHNISSTEADSLFKQKICS
jgi:hypothetical protein